MRCLAACLLLLAPLALAPGQGKKDKDKAKDLPKIILAQPFGLSPGSTTRVTLRGLKLDSAREVKTTKGTAKLLKKMKVAVPQMMEASRVGDTQVELDVSLPADIAGGEVELTVVTDAGTAARKLFVDRTPPVAEKEPNDGFKQAQAVKVGQTVTGTIGRAQDVDVFKFDAKANDKVVVEVFAARLGSALDSFLTVYDADGQVVATSDDTEGSSDSRLELTLAKAGSYYASVTDAHDQGGALHPYRLVIRAK